MRLCSDYAHSLDIRTQPQVESMFTIRLEQQNVIATIQRWNEELLNEVSVKESRKVARSQGVDLCKRGKAQRATDLQ